MKRHFNWLKNHIKLALSTLIVVPLAVAYSFNGIVTTKSSTSHDRLSNLTTVTSNTVTSSTESSLSSRLVSTSSTNSTLQSLTSVPIASQASSASQTPITSGLEPTTAIQAPATTEGSTTTSIATNTTTTVVESTTAIQAPSTTSTTTTYLPPATVSWGLWQLQSSLATGSGAIPSNVILATDSPFEITAYGSPQGLMDFSVTPSSYFASSSIGNGCSGIPIQSGYNNFGVCFITFGKPGIYTITMSYSPLEGASPATLSEEVTVA